ncbi:MAG: hypothetical protein R2939_06885 [Kofleriaceae bacterium]
MPPLRARCLREALTVGALAALAACGGGATQASTTPPTPAADPVLAAQARACWPGQRYDLDEGRCVGQPTECPQDREVASTSCRLRVRTARPGVGDRVVRGPDWDRTLREGRGLGTVITPVRSGWAEVNWDDGVRDSYRWGAGGNYDLELALDAPPVQLAERDRVVAGPRCKRCPDDVAGVVEALLPGDEVRVRWFDGSDATMEVGIGGVLPSFPPYYPIAVGERVRPGPRAEAASGLGTVVAHELGSTTVEVRWDDGKVGSYGWRGPDASGVVVAADAPPLPLALGWRVVAGPGCAGCPVDGRGDVVAVAGAGAGVTVRWC